ncbi:Cupredoxin [Salix suchowensis]|nr:Cupredoxin [Salix suchowensis]
MVFAVNPPAEPSPRSFTAFRNLAIATNGTASSSAAASSTASSSAVTDGYVTPPAPHFETVTVTVTLPSSTYTTVYNSYDGTPPPTPAPQIQDHKITVGADGQLAYSPANIQAAIGDTVTFEFRPRTTRSPSQISTTPANPCSTRPEKLASALACTMPVSPDATQFPTFQIKINDTAPIWGYCGQTGHCGSGMVFAINAVESGPNNFVAFQALLRGSMARRRPAHQRPRPLPQRI